MSNKTFDILRGISEAGLYAVGLFYATIATVWHLPYAEEVLKTMTAIGAFLAVVLKIARGQYNDEKSKAKHDE